MSIFSDMSEGSSVGVTATGTLFLLNGGATLLNGGSTTTIEADQLASLGVPAHFYDIKVLGKSFEAKLFIGGQKLVGKPGTYAEGKEGWEITDPAVYETALLLAVEALLAYGRSIKIYEGIEFSGFYLPDGQVRIRVPDGRIFTKKDLNLPTLTRTFAD